MTSASPAKMPHLESEISSSQFVPTPDTSPVPSVLGGHQHADSRPDWYVAELSPSDTWTLATRSVDDKTICGADVLDSPQFSKESHMKRPLPLTEVRPASPVAVQPQFQRPEQCPLGVQRIRNRGVISSPLSPSDTFAGAEIADDAHTTSSITYLGGHLGSHDARDTDTSSLLEISEDEATTAGHGASGRCGDAPRSRHVSALLSRIITHISLLTLSRRMIHSILHVMVI